MARVLSRGAIKVPSGLLGGLCKTPKGGHEVTQVAFITGKKLRENRPPRPPPFDYKNNRYRAWHVWWDPMEKRFDDNSKVIVVDGLPAVGKAKFCSKLAEELEMYHFPSMTFDDLYIDRHGFDYRSLNPKLPIDVQFCDLNGFYDDPKGRNSTTVQVHQYGMRYLTYVDALAHVLNTGVGVVLERSPWSDRVFAKAMETCGFINRNCLDYYKSCNSISLHRILRPHLNIYLDAPVDSIKAKIDKRCRPHEKNSPAMTTQFLTEIDRTYKEVVLPEVSRHAHLLVYDWENEGIMDDVVDDIEGLECDPYQMETRDEKLMDWRFSSPDEVRAARTMYTNHRYQLSSGCFTCRWDVPEVLTSGQSNAKLFEVLEELYDEDEGKKYMPGFDPTRDKGVLWKIKDSGDDFRPFRALQQTKQVEAK